MQRSHMRLKMACYTTNITMAVIGNLSPVLFITFRTLYGISYSLLGLLVLINFCTQLTVDTLFSLFSHKFNIPKAVKMTPVLSVVGLLLYMLAPTLFPNSVYAGLVIGTIIFSAASGFSEVLISPVIAAIPSENPDHEMSKLHSIYAWGVVFVVIFATLFLFIFQQTSWQWLVLILIAIPLTAAILFSKAEIPQMETPEKMAGVIEFMKKKELWISVIAIFLGGAAECTMAQWSSGYLEKAVGLPKIWGDIFGVAMFGATLGLGRTLYSKYGKNPEKILFYGAIGATACYAVATIVDVEIIGLIACAATGFFVSMLWPGNLIVAAERIPKGGVFMYAIMAAGGDLGASIGPQLVGSITDMVAANTQSITLAQNLGLTVEQLGMKAGMLVGTIFPLIAIFVYLYLMKTRNNKKENA
ncbi:MAG: MFS transporter [Clostridia bacterium]|nr:MFS transporter [Clostridia bacterium]